ncbi:hypothetical protein JCM6882_009336 [Rhodosporidiobolus microsporus]
MLSPQARYLPLQPLAGSPAMMDAPLDGPISPLELPASCSIASLRQGFDPFPLRPAQAQRLSFVTLCNKVDEKTSPESFLGELVVRPMKRADVEAVKRLQDDHLPVSYPSSFYTVLLTTPTSLCLVAYSPSSPSTILGTISASVSFPSSSSLSSSLSPTATAPALPSIYILSLAVAPSARNQGLASHLLHAVTKALLPRPLFLGFKQRARVHLHVDAANPGAVRLYKKVGMEEKTRVRGFYRRLQSGGNGEAIEMEGVLTA